MLDWNAIDTVLLDMDGTLLDLHSRKVVDDRHVVAAIKPQQLNEILHPIINPTSATKLKALKGSK